MVIIAHRIRKITRMHPQNSQVASYIRCRRGSSERGKEESWPGMLGLWAPTHPTPLSSSKPSPAVKLNLAMLWPLGIQSNGLKESTKGWQGTKRVVLESHSGEHIL